MAVGGGLVPVVLPGVSTAARKPQGERQGRGEPGRRGAGSGLGWGRLLAGVGEGFPVVLSVVSTAAGNAPGAHPGRGKPGLRGSGFRWLWVGVWSQLCSQGSPLRLGMPISYAPVSPRIHI